MSLPWHEIRDHLARSPSTLRFQHRFERIRQGAPAVKSFGNPAALPDTLHRIGVGPERRNAILAALVEAAQGEGPPVNCALTPMLLALWPGLDAIRHRSLRPRIGASDGIAAVQLA